MSNRVSNIKVRAAEEKLPELRALLTKLADPGAISKFSSRPSDSESKALAAELRAVLTAAGSPSDVEPRIDQSSFSAGPRARAILRGKEIAARDLKDSGGCYSLDEVRLLLNGISRQSVEKSVREGRLLAVLGPNNKRFYPVAQFRDDGAIVEGLRDVRDALDTENGYAILNFLVNPNYKLDNRKPIDLLKRGEVEIVAQAARLDGEQGG